MQMPFIWRGGEICISMCPFKSTIYNGLTLHLERGHHW